MSGFAYNLKYTTAMTPIVVTYDDEGAGKIGKVIGAVVAIAIPFAAPAIFGAFAASTAIGASISGALTGAFGAGLGSAIGAAAVGALGSAGAAYLGGARGGDVWRAAGIGAIGGGLGSLAGLGGGRATLGAGTGATAGTGAGGGIIPATGGAGALSNSGMANSVLAASAPTGGGLGAITSAVSTATSGASQGILSTLGRMFGNNPQLVTRLGSAIVNAAVNGTNIQGMEDLVAQQRAELQALQQQDAAAYAQRIEAANKVLDVAKRMDPDWLGKVRMADVMGVMNREHDQAQRNIAVKQGGSLDRGQAKAYERSGRLAIGRAKAGAYASGQKDGMQAQAQLFGQAAGLFTGPNFAPWEADTDLRLGLQRARQQNNRDTAAGFVSAFGERMYQQPTSPETNTNQNNNEDPFASGNTNPFGGG